MSNMKNDKNYQKYRKQKNMKINKIRKIQKVTKSENAKSTKSENQKSEKHKKTPKIDPPLKKAKMSLKWPKTALCEIRAAWSGVFWVPGGTTGPGFKAEIRPPLKLMFFDTFYVISTFSFCAFYQFWCFHSCDKSDIFMEVTFFTIACAITLRPYYITQGRARVCVVVLPSSWSWLFASRDWKTISCRGDYTEEFLNLLLSFSPLWTGVIQFMFV